MAWRSSTTTQERVLASLTYGIPLIEVAPLGSFLFLFIPPLGWLFSPFLALQPIYRYSMGGLAVVAWGTFFALFLGVVRNQRLSSLLRFNAAQAVLMGIFATLCLVGLELLGIPQQLITGLNPNAIGSFNLLLLAILTSAIFLFVAGGAIYSIVQALRGQYPAIPIISKAADSLLR